MDQNRKHFPTLLITCVILSIICFFTAFIISSAHQKKINLKNKSNQINDKQQFSQLNQEEQQIEKDLHQNQ